MIKLAGIWIDKEKALIITLNKGQHKLKAVVSADSMTENQMVAWVKDFYHI